MADQESERTFTAYEVQAVLRAVILAERARAYRIVREALMKAERW